MCASRERTRDNSLLYFNGRKSWRSVIFLFKLMSSFFFFSKFVTGFQTSNNFLSLKKKKLGSAISNFERNKKNI